MQLLRGQLASQWRVDSDTQLPDPKFWITDARSITSGPLAPFHPVLLQEISQFKKQNSPHTERVDCPRVEPPTHPSCLSLVLPSSTSPATSGRAPAKRENSIARCVRERPHFPSKCPAPQSRQPLLSTGVVGASGLKGSSVPQPGGRGLGLGWAPQETEESRRTTPRPLLKREAGLGCSQAAFAP